MPEIEDQRWCKCKTCGRVNRCTPAFDFYVGPPGVMTNSSGLPLECERCMRDRLVAHGIKVDMPPLEDA